MPRDTAAERAFMLRPKIRSLSKSERDKRWRQHLMSKGGDLDLMEREGRRPTPRARAPRGVIRGRGDYFTDFGRKRFPKGSFRTAGKTAGNFLASMAHPHLGAAGEAAGGALGDKLAHLVGFGDYEVKYNTLLDPSAAAAVTNGAGFGVGKTVMISHRECVGAVRVSPLEPGETSSAFQYVRYRIQPTNELLFKWLSNIANNFSGYRVHGLIFSIETTSSPYAPTVGLGRVAIATQHNANARPIVNMNAVMNYENSASGNPAQDIAHGVECDPELQEQEMLYTRRKGAQGPPNLYDFGVVTVATEGLPAAACGPNLGNLFVTYQVEFRNASLPPLSSADGRVLAVNGSYNGLPADTPPLGPSLNLLQSHLKTTPDYLMLSVGSVGDSEVELLRPKAGPYVFPDIGDMFRNMVFFISDDTSTPCTQHLGFRYQGYYDVTMVGINIGTNGPQLIPSIDGENGTLAYLIGGRSLVTATPAGPPSSDSVFWKVWVPEPGLSIKISMRQPTIGGMTFSCDLIVTTCTPWDTSIPNVSGGPLYDLQWSSALPPPSSAHSLYDPKTDDCGFSTGIDKEVFSCKTVLFNDLHLDDTDSITEDADGETVHEAWVGISPERHHPTAATQTQSVTDPVVSK